MIIGILKEIKAEENRVAMTPGGLEVMVQNGHRVFLEKDAGKASGFQDTDYAEAGAEIVNGSSDIFLQAEMILRVREPQPNEYELIREDQILFNFFHLASSKSLTRSLIKTGAICIAYETIQKSDGFLPLLTQLFSIKDK